MSHPTTTEQAWLDRYADYYDTDDERREGYRDYKANLATMTEVFAQRPPRRRDEPPTPSPTTRPTPRRGARSDRGGKPVLARSR